jgi:hypothetical protein
MALMNPSCLKQAVSQQRWTTQATTTLKKTKNTLQGTTPIYFAEWRSCEL